MFYRLRDGVSYCPVGGCLIFLDLNDDRYFRLSNRMEKLFVAYLSGSAQSDVDVHDLVRQNILVPTLEAGRRSSALQTADPTLSAIEQRSPLPTFDLWILLEVLATICTTQWQLKTRHLSRIVAEMASYRQRRASRLTITSDGSQARRSLDSANAFRDARRYVPIDTSCLLDSIALVKFLARRKLSSDLIFGVTQDPFAAHCWVQAGEYVLNDTVGNVIAHTPIRKV